MARTRRNPWRENAPLVLLAMFFVVGTVASLNFVSLWQNHQRLSALHAQIAALHQQEASIKQQEQFLSSRQTLLDLARREYQLVQQNEQLVQVLPAATSRSYAGDPANDPIVSPTSAVVVGLATPHASHPSFWTRVKDTLEFWR